MRRQATSAIDSLLIAARSQAANRSEREPGKIDVWVRDWDSATPVKAWVRNAEEDEPECATLFASYENGTCTFDLDSFDIDEREDD